MRRPALLVATVIVAVSVLTGCATSGADEAGYGLGSLAAQDAHAALDRAGVTAEELRGTLLVRPDGCFTWSGDEGDGAWIVWPDSAVPDPDDGGRVVLPGGPVVSDGSTLSGQGSLVTLADLPEGDNPDSYFGSYGGFCDADTRGVILLTDVAPG